MTLFAFMMPGPTEMIVIGVIAVLLFGRKLPKLAFDLGSSFTQLKRGMTMPADALEDCADEFSAKTRDLNSTVRKEHADLKRTAESV